MATDHPYLDIYCERLDGTFWAEPINAVTNAAFLVAAFAAWHLARRTNGALSFGRVPLDQVWLILILAMIGVGSFLFHTSATSLAMLADVIPIFMYKVSFLAFYARWVVGLSLLRVVMLIAGFIVLGNLTYALPKDWLNGSLGYAPAWLFLIGFAVYHWRARRREPYLLLTAAGVFTVSLTFRSLDMALCGAVPFGVHFLWHILNAVVLYLTTRAYILNRPFLGRVLGPGR